MQKLLVKIINEHGKTLSGKFISNTFIKNVLTSLNAPHVMEWGGYMWDKMHYLPFVFNGSTKKRDVEYYLIFDHRGRVCIKETASITDNNYLIAELEDDGDFILTENCKIEVF